MKVSDAVRSRRSIRAFLDRPVDLDQLIQLIERATRAPSGGNLQPWHIHVVVGEAMIRFRARAQERAAENPFGHGAEYAVYPPGLGEPYRTRRFELGEAMYAALGIPREDKPARLQWFKSNLDFFGAPVGLFCYVPRDHGPPQWSDCGMMLQTLMLLLREAGLDSCSQEFWAAHHDLVGAFVDAPKELMLFTGMAIGYADPDAPINNWPVPRAPIDEVLTVHRD